MHRNFLSNDPQDYIQTTQSIDAQSQFSVDLKSGQIDSLLTKIFLLSIELDRKDVLIEKLRIQGQSRQMKKSQIDFSNKELNQRYQRLEQQYLKSIQNNAVLNNQLKSSKKKIGELQVYKNHTIYNKELEDKIRMLESQLKSMKEKNIQLVQSQKELKKRNSMLAMLEFKQQQNMQKNRIKNLENQLLQEKNKLEIQRKHTYEQKTIVQEYSRQIRTLKQRQVNFKNSYQQKISMLKANQDLRQSKISLANEQKIVLMSQQLNRLKQEVDYLRNLLKEQKMKVEMRDQEIMKANEEISGIETDMKKMKDSFIHNQGQFVEKQRFLLAELERIEKEGKGFQRQSKELEFHIKQKAIEDGDRLREIQRLRDEVESLQEDKNASRAEIRKLKRQSMVKAECQTCKARASISSIPSGKSLTETMNPLDLQTIINETEKLKLSNSKVEKLISNHEISSHHSIEQKMSHVQISEQNLIELQKI